MMFTLKNNILYLLLCMNFLFLGCRTTYVRNSDLHDLKLKREIKLNKLNKSITLIERNNESVIVNKKKIKYDKKNLNHEAYISFLENKSVLFFQNSYWIKKGLPLEKFAKYINADLKWE